MAAVAADGQLVSRDVPPAVVIAWFMLLLLLQQQLVLSCYPPCRLQPAVKLPAIDLAADCCSSAISSSWHRSLLIHCFNTLLQAPGPL